MAVMKRYQNIKRANCAVSKMTAQGQQTITMRPGQIVSLTKDDVQASNDAHRNPEDSPFIRGWIVEIPAGKPNHPDAPYLGRNPTVSEATSAIESGEDGRMLTMLEQIVDRRGITMVRRALTTLEDKISKDRHKKVDNLIAKAEGRVDATMAEAENEAL